MQTRIKVVVDNILRQEQAGFRPGRSCNEQFFVLRQIIKKVTTWKNPVIINFIDFKKAFDSVHRATVRTILSQYGISDKSLKLFTICSITVEGLLE